MERESKYYPGKKIIFDTLDKIETKNAKMFGPKSKDWGTPELDKKLQSEYFIPPESSERMNKGGWLVVEENNEIQIWLVQNNQVDSECILYKTLELSA